MPYSHETEKMLIPSSLRRNTKLTPEQREEIKINADNLSNHQLADKYGVSRRLVQFIRHPERLAKNLEDRRKRGGSKVYYDKYGKEYHAEKIRETRRYKQKLKKEGKLLCPLTKKE